MITKSSVQTSEPGTLSRHTFTSRCLADILPAVVVVLILWLPFGFALTGLLEEWGILGLFVNNGVFFFTGTTSPLAAHALRPLTIFPQAVAYWLDGNSFDYWHVLLMIALVIKGSAVSYLLRNLTGSMKLGMIASVLVIIYPADTMQLSFRAIHINWALSLALLGSALFLFALNLQRKLHAGLVSALGATLFSAACFMYEASLLLACIPALVIYSKVGMKRALQQMLHKVTNHGIWLLGVGVYLAYVIHTAPLVKSYQSSLAGKDLVSTLTTNFPKLFSVGLMRSSLGGWFDAARITALEFVNYGYLITSSLLLTLLITLLAKRYAQPVGPARFADLSMNARLALSGLALLLLGYAPFLLSGAHLVINQRTFLFATPGAVLLWLAAINTGLSLSRPLTNACIGFLFVTGISFQLYQFHHYVEISKKQMGILKDIANHFDGQLNNRTMLILDYGNQLNHTWMFIADGLNGSLSYLYGKPVSNIQVCHMPSGEWQQTDAVQRKGRCIQGDNGWTFEYPTSVSGPGFPTTTQPKSLTIAKSDIVTVEIGRQTQADSVTDASNSTKPVMPANVLPDRYQSIVDVMNEKTHFIRFKDMVVNDDYRWSFGKWWSMELPTQGSGWRETSWDVNYFHHQPSAWKSEKQSSLIFRFAPKEGRQYVLEGRFSLLLNNAIMNSMAISINGSPVTLSWGEMGNFKAMIDQGVLRHGPNVIEFSSLTDDNYFGLSAILEGIHISRQH
ncbi:hypothetical protein EVS84_00705 [Pseudomonas koreensis]|uniref:Glycosyltransferase RgtA/B/C/D-like domain-containing protein n=2 Tax=Pseudomonas TaxID=286 RepID=A0A4Q4L8U2_9PSED|nr:MULTISPECIES: hypothetical protein [Pseudomonas]MDM8190704.1 hypothetical protein [Pseudomonas fluorescens]MDP8571949.1 hypothetical protein [Pseudomonas iranensis]RYM44296.1 hypothetical protein EVS84_00705 [Pseudomonas koreensis]